jgi:hypothetical protein
LNFFKLFREMPTKSFAAYHAPPVAFCRQRNQQRITTCGKVGARHSKEVARMIKINRTITAQSPAFGVSAYGQTSLEAAAISPFGDVQVSTCARVRHIGDMGLATTTGFPGTSAWRPPSC